METGVRSWHCVARNDKKCLHVPIKFNVNSWQWDRKRWKFNSNQTTDPESQTIIWPHIWHPLIDPFDSILKWVWSAQFFIHFDVQKYFTFSLLLLIVYYFFYFNTELQHNITIMNFSTVTCNFCKNHQKNSKSE